MTWSSPANITVDGVVEATDDWFGRAGEADPEVDAVLARQRDASDGFLVGRETFIGMRDFWGPMTDDTTGVTDHLNSVAKFVVSQSLTDPGWANTEVLSGPLTDDVTRIKSLPGGDIICTGSISLCHDLISAGLVDEFRLFVSPYARGTGRRLFEGTAPVRLLLTESLAFPSGVTLARYRTA